MVIMASTAQGKDNLGCVTLPRLGVSTVEEQRDQTAQLHDGFTKSFCVQNLGFFFQHVSVFRTEGLFISCWQKSGRQCTGSYYLFYCFQLHFDGNCAWWYMTKVESWQKRNGPKSLGMNELATQNKNSRENNKSHYSLINQVNLQ